MPPQVRNESLAQLLADIAAATHEEINRNAYCALLAVKITMLVSDFLEERSDALIDLYSAKLNLPAEPKFKVEVTGNTAGCAFVNEVGNPISMGVAGTAESVSVCVVGPDSTVDHEWTAVEASVLAALIQKVQS